MKSDVVWKKGHVVTGGITVAPMIFFNIGWMIDYRGQTAADSLKGGFKYIKEYGTGHEQCNFLPMNGRLYGYAPVKSINIERIGANPVDDRLEGADVIFFSRNPRDGKAYIVGWYRNATLYRKGRELKGRRIAGKQWYVAETSAEDGVCLPQSRRTFFIPSAFRMKGGYGQSPLWYGDKLPGFKENVRKYISEYTSGVNKAKTAIAAPKNVNLEAKLLVEQTAVDVVRSYYTNLGFKVESVEKDNCGWDLIATHPSGDLRIEVKGLSGQKISVQLTPNEYNMLKKYHNDYILAVCTNTLSNPELHIFMICKQDDGGFIACDDDGNILEFSESISAVAQLRE